MAAVPSDVEFQPARVEFDMCIKVVRGESRGDHDVRPFWGVVEDNLAPPTTDHQQYESGVSS